jgi:ABC-2 type transport system permease protein
VLNGESSPVPMTQLFFESYYFWLILLVSSPIITMRSFAQEKASGTYETLMTTPVGDGQVVLAKFTGALLFYLILWLPLLGCLFVVRHYSNDPTAFEPRIVASTYLGIFLLGALYMAVGVFASALTRIQIIAAIVSLALGFTLLMPSLVAAAFELKTGWRAQLVGYMDTVDHLRDFASGVVDSRALVCYVSLTAFFLFLTWRVIESRRWK